MTHVFISYSHKDADFAQELKQQIENAGFDHWIDGDQIKGSQNWVEEILEAIDTAYALIVIKSPASFDSQYVTSEWSYALRAGVPIIPVLYKVQPTTHAWLELNAIHHLDFTNPAKRAWAELFWLLEEKYSQHGNRVRIPKDAPRKVRSGLEKLNSDIPEDVRVGAKLLGDLKDPIAVPGLVITLRRDNGDFEVLEAQKALEKIGEPGVPQLLKEFTKQDENENTRYRIAIALGQIKSDSALFGLLDALHDQRARVRYFAVYGLKQMKRAEAIPQLLELLHDQDSNVRSESIGALIEIGDYAAVPALIELLKDDDKDIRSAAAGGLGALGDARAVPGLRNALHDAESYVRIAAAHALGRLRDLDSIEDLLRLSEDPVAAVRQAGLDALNEIHKTYSVVIDVIKRWPSQPRNT